MNLIQMGLRYDEAPNGKTILVPDKPENLPYPMTRFSGPGSMDHKKLAHLKPRSVHMENMKRGYKV